MDPLSDILALLRPHTYAGGGFQMSGAWSVRFAVHETIKCYAVVSGSCWLAVDGIEPVELHAGDCFLLPRGLPFRLCSDLHLQPRDAYEALRLPLQGRIATFDGPPGGRGPCLGIGAGFSVSGSQVRALLEELPPIIRIDAEAGRAELHASIERLRQELLDPRPGSTLMSRQLATMMLIQTLRLHVTTQRLNRPGWLAALADPRLAPAIGAMHSRPAQPWTLAALARLCGMSRSVFAREFRARMNLPPIDYLLRWRMMLAEDQLIHATDPVATVAAGLGYRSESAFSKAFRRIHGASPRQLRAGGSPWPPHNPSIHPPDTTNPPDEAKPLSTANLPDAAAAIPGSS